MIGSGLWILRIFIGKGRNNACATYFCQNSVSTKKRQTDKEYSSKRTEIFKFIIFDFLCVNIFIKVLIFLQSSPVLNIATKTHLLLLLLISEQGLTICDF